MHKSPAVLASAMFAAIPSIRGSWGDLFCSQRVEDPCRSMSISATLRPLDAMYPARLNASVVFPEPPFGFKTTILCKFAEPLNRNIMTYCLLIRCKPIFNGQRTSQPQFALLADSIVSTWQHCFSRHMRHAGLRALTMHRSTAAVDRFGSGRLSSKSLRSTEGPYRSLKD